MIKGSILQKNTTILTCKWPEIEQQAMWGKKPSELQGEIDESIIIVGDINILLLRNGQIQQTENQQRHS